MPALRDTRPQQKPFLLTVRPVDFSLTEGTNIPPPPDSPIKEVRPATPERRIPGAYPESDVDDDEVAASNNAMSAPTSPQEQRQVKGVRRLFSMSNLRSSFSSSRTSLALPRQSTDRPSTSRQQHRPFTPSVSSTASASPMQPQQTLRRRGSGWFKRKSSMFSLNSANEDVDGRENKRLKNSYSVPLLPDISELGGGELDGGDLGWDSSAFTRGM